MLLSKLLCIPPLCLTNIFQFSIFNFVSILFQFSIFNFYWFFIFDCWFSTQSSLWCCLNSIFAATYIALLQQNCVKQRTNYFVNSLRTPSWYSSRWTNTNLFLNILFICLYFSYKNTLYITKSHIFDLIMLLLILFLASIANKRV